MRLIHLQLVVLSAACSLLNRKGPDVTCADLGDGAENGCENGIIATCDRGTVTWSVCGEESACEEPWQQPGRFRCEEFASSGGSTTSSATTGAGELTCGFEYLPASCATCIQTNCCEESTACANDAQCADCVTRLGNESQCVPDSVPLMKSLVVCEYSACPDSC